MNSAVVPFASGPGSPAQPLSNLGVLGDIHVEDERLQTSIAWLRAQGTERIVHVGDVCDGRGSLSRTLELLADNDIVGVCGNHERWFLTRAMRELRLAHPASMLTSEVQSTLSSFPAMRRIETVLGPLLLCHGVGSDDMMVLKPDTILGFLSGTPAFDALLASAYRFVVAGHTHVHAVHPVEHLTWINAGTLKYDDVPVVTRIDFKNAEVSFASLSDPARIGDLDKHPLLR